MQLLDLPAPEVIEEFDFETIKQRKLDTFMAIAKTKGIEYVPSESDDVMTMIETDSYEEMLLRTRINNAVKAELLLFAKGSDLDHLGATRYGVVRLEGSKPYASFTFTLSAALTYDINFPRNMQLSDGKGAIAILLEDAYIKAGEMTVTGVVELQEYVSQSEITTEIIVTPLPYVVIAKQNGIFENGADIEDDERFRERIWLSRESKSTAGSVLTYKYYATTADVRVKDVQVLMNTPGVVELYLLSEDGSADSVMIDRVDEALNVESVRPLTDEVKVYSATIIEATIEANIVLYDMTYEVSVRELIESRIAANTRIFGKELTLPKIYGILESEMVKDITLLEPTQTIACADNEVIDVITLKLNFSEVV